MRRVGIISGVPEELAAFRPDLSRVQRPLGSTTVEQLMHDDVEVLLACLGIGKVAAATAATLLAGDGRVDLLLVLGTAGKISDIDGHLFRITEAVQGDYGAMRSSGFVHYPAGTLPIGPTRQAHFAAAPLPDLGLPTARIATGDMFVECATHSGRLRDGLAADLVDMETAAVAQTATLLGLPWAAIKATTDGADDGSAGSFAANLATAARAAAEAAERLISALRA